MQTPSATAAMSHRPGPDPADLPRHRHPVLDGAQLFAGGRELVIRHDGADYRLRITRQNKLILTK